MKKTIIVLLTVFAFMFASEPDTTSTSLKISDLQYFSLHSSENLLSGQEIKKDLKPFAIIQPNDKWFSKDKWMHFTTAYFITLQSTYTLDKMLFVPQKDARNASIGIALSLSLGKELYDVFEKKSIFSWKDLCYDVLGAGLGYYTTQLIK
jgi:putative lipoprotein